MSKIKSFFTKENITKKLDSDGAHKVYSSIICVIIGLLAGFILMLCLSPVDALMDFPMLISGGLVYYGLEGFGNILANMAPLLVCGVAIIFAYKTGVFNIGAAGQYIMGSFGAIIFALYFKLSWPVCILMAIVNGAVWGVIPALLKSYCKVNEVISGIMLNWIALLFVNYSYQTYLSSIVDPGTGFQTLSIKDNNIDAVLPNMGLNSLGSNFSIAIIIAVLVAIIAIIVIDKTTFGYQLKASGLNHNATKYAGMNAKKNMIFTMMISGGLAGLGASLYYLSGIECWSATASTTLPQVPWNGIIVAFIAQMNPIGGIFASMFMSLISIGATATSQSVFPKEIADLITALIVYLSGLTAITMRFVPWIKEHIFKKKKLVTEVPLTNETTKKEGK